MICTIHYLKIVLNFYNIYRYYYNIRDYTPHHPVSHLNTFLMITFYYFMLFVNIKELQEDRLCVYLIGLYPLSDLSMVAISLFKMRKVIVLKTLIERNQDYQVF